MALTLVATSAMAQYNESAYFTQGNLYRHEMNPALAADDSQKSYVSMPFLGNMAMGVKGNLGIENFLYKKNGKTVTFLHPDVSASEFLGDVKDKNKFLEDFKMQIFGVGKKTSYGFNTFELNLRENVSLVVPGSFLELAKEGLTNRTYDISDLSAHADAFVELAFGHSRKLNDKLSVGAKLKVLLGAGNVDLNVNKAYLTAGADGNYTATVDAEIHGNVKGMQFKNKQGKDELDKADVDGAGLGGWGLAVDLGATYKFNEDWTFSAALIDFGFINWNTDAVAKANGTHNVKVGDYSYLSSPHGFTDGSGKDLDDAFTDIKDVFQLKADGDNGSRSKMLAATLNFGAEYKAPFYDPLTFGLLNTTRINGNYTWTDFRLSANVAPAKFFSAGLNFSAGTFGTGIGWILDLHPKGIGLFISMDHMFGKLAKQGAPLNSNGEFAMGLNFPF